MRQEIAVRTRAEAELEKARDELERRVAERTAELLQTNESLSREIAERKQAEEAQRQLEAQLRQSQKMEAVGTLAGGIAHDFNNILSVIIPYTQLALEDAGDNKELQDNLNRVLLAADRARHLVRQILIFSQPHRQERRVINLQSTVEDALKLLRSALPSTIEMVPQLDPVPTTLADPTQIHQVIMNLCTNAEHAMSGRPGRLEIELGTAPVDEVFSRRHPNLRPGQHIRIGVRDNGCGMPREMLNRIFEPFFTTKGPGQGTGLGLAVAHGIVKSHGGAILVQSEPGVGTEFQIFLPVQMPVPEGKPAAQPPEPGLAAAGRGERLLLVDDEPSVLGALSETLSRAGYKVTSLTDPRAALEAFRARPAEFDLLFTDLTMPGLTGFELARQVMTIRTDLPVIVATGFGGNSVSDATTPPNVRKIVEKPFNPRRIASTVREALQPKKN